MSKTPPMLAEAIRHLGLHEIPGRKSNPVIMDWADEIDVENAYTNDDIPWCGLFAAHLATHACPDIPLTPNPLSARNWGGRDVVNGGSHQGWGAKGPMEDLPFGGLGILWRTDLHGSWHGHIGCIFAQNATHVGFIGGNQHNEVSYHWYSRNKLLGTRVAPGEKIISAPKLETGATGGSMT